MITKKEFETKKIHFPEVYCTHTGDGEACKIVRKNLCRKSGLPQVRHHRGGDLSII